jgi:Oxysterol-binding protein
VFTLIAINTQITQIEEYVITMPSMYARGILFGKMVLELGDSCTIRNERTGMHCDIDFKTKVRTSYDFYQSIC